MAIDMCDAKNCHKPRYTGENGPPNFQQHLTNLCKEHFFHLLSITGATIELDTEGVAYISFPAYIGDPASPEALLEMRAESLRNTVGKSPPELSLYDNPLLKDLWDDGE